MVPEDPLTSVVAPCCSLPTSKVSLPLKGPSGHVEPPYSLGWGGKGTGKCRASGLVKQLSLLSGLGNLLEPGTPWTGLCEPSSKLKGGRCHPSAVLSVLLLWPEPRQALAAMPSWRASPIYHKETCFGQDLGPSSAVLSSFKEGEVGQPGGSSQTKQTN